MASLDHRLNPLFSIKECSSCGALYTADFCCSKGSLEDKILVPKPPQNCATCGDPVDGLYCRPCAFVRKCLNEVTSICDMVGQYMQKKEEDRRIREDQAAKDRYWKIPICYEDDEDYTIAITPVLSYKEAVDFFIMGGLIILDTIPQRNLKRSNKVFTIVHIVLLQALVDDPLNQLPLCCYAFDCRLWKL
ncbi:hypothetical protein Tco_0885780 [Tanacetum coccineum]